MISIEKKLQRLAAVAAMYYEENLTQSEIAKRIGVSRPMVSKLLADAKELGVVTITIRQAVNPHQMLASQLAERYALQQVIVVKGERAAADTNASIARAAFDLMTSFPAPHRIGMGWGSMAGKMADYVESCDSIEPLQGELVPLIGGIKASFRSYHPNELVRILADKTGLNAAYLYMPAIFDSSEERLLFENTEAFRAIHAKWSRLTTAILNLSNYPSSPDIATAGRFDSRLALERAAGYFLAHYYDEKGSFIEPKRDIAMQISVEQLRATPNVIAMCNCLVQPESLAGALHTGVIDHLVLGDELAVSLLRT